MFPRKGPAAPTNPEERKCGPGLNCSGLHRTAAGALGQFHSLPDSWKSVSSALVAAQGVVVGGATERRSGAGRLSSYPRLQLSFCKRLLGEPTHRAGQIPSPHGSCLFAVTGVER